MQANKRRDTSPELALRSELHRRGLRYRVDHRPLPNIRYSADIVFARARVAVFVDGCFWHPCPDHYKSPRANPDYWLPKMARNRQRDAEVTASLQKAGGAVLRLWEHETTESMADVIAAALEEVRKFQPAVTPRTRRLECSHC